MERIFLDTNIVLDFLLKRDGFGEEAAMIFNLGEQKKLNLALSSLSINNIDYLVAKVASRKYARETIIKLLSLVDILAVDQVTIKKAAMSRFTDFEDAIQNFCAEQNGLKHFLTRNLKDYKESSLSVMTPKEFLANLKINGR